MMRFSSRSGKAESDSEDGEVRTNQSAIHYDSVLWIDSSTTPGVRFAIHRISFGRRMELSRRIRELSRKAEFLDAGTDLHEKIEANILAQEIDALYLRWGLAGIEGLTIDGDSATPDNLLERGPERLVREIVSAVRAECALSEAERKN